MQEGENIRLYSNNIKRNAKRRAEIAEYFTA